jgi:hypothetical protein
MEGTPIRISRLLYFCMSVCIVLVLDSSIRLFPGVRLYNAMSIANADAIDSSCKDSYGLRAKTLHILGTALAGRNIRLGKSAWGLGFL